MTGYTKAKDKTTYPRGLKGIMKGRKVRLINDPVKERRQNGKQMSGR